MDRKNRKGSAENISRQSSRLKPQNSLRIHHGRKIISSFLPRPWKKHRSEINQQRMKKAGIVDDIEKKIEFNERDERVLTVPFGCLSFHILELQNLSVAVSSFEPSAPLYFYCVLTMGKIKRVTNVVQSPTPKTVRMDSAILFSIELSEWRENYRNKLKVEVWTFQDPESHYIIGNVVLHAYVFVHHIHGIDSHYIWGEGILRGKLIYEYTFAYGAFGYGHSNQLKNTDSAIFETVCHSMFPRLKLEEGDIVEEKFKTILPSRLKLMTMNSFVLEKVKGNQNQQQNSGQKGRDAHTEKFIVPKSITLHQVEFHDGYPVHCKVNMAIHQREIEADFNEAYGDYLCIKKREERLDFCRRLVEGRREDIRETEYATPLFKPLPPDEVEDILNSQTDPSSMDKPRNQGCQQSHKCILYEDDEPFLQKFPSTDRSPGYIGRIFGFSKHDPSEEKPDFPLKELQGKIRKHETQITMRLWIRYIWSRFGAFLFWLRNTIMPKPKSQQKIPEVSVTLPSPDISTTNLLVLWVQDDPPKGPLNEEQILRNEAHRFGLPVGDEDEKGKELEDTDSEDDWIVNGEVTIKSKGGKGDITTEKKKK